MFEVSPYNKIAGKPSEVRIADCTLRDGEQQPGLAFSVSEKVEIAKWLDKIGVYEIEAGMPCVSRDDFEAVQQIVALNPKAKISALARATAGDIDIVKKTGAWGVRISLPCSPIQRKYKLRKSDEETLKMALEAAELARESGLHVIFSPYDTTRCDLPFLVRLTSELSNRQLVDRLRLVDTVGCATPSAIRFLATVMKESSGGLPIEVHTHNDFGMAVACSVEAVLAGCEYVSCTVNGLGSRCGNAALEEVVVALEGLLGISTGIEMKYLKEISSVVERISGVRLQPHKAVVGSNAFAHETGLTVAGVLNNPFVAEAYDPETVGQKRSLVLGKKSGLASIKDALRTHDLVATDEVGRRILEDVKDLACTKGSSITDDEFLAIVGKYVVRGEVTKA